MKITNPASEWEREEPQKTLLDTMQALHDRGHTIEELKDVTLVLTLYMDSNQYGPRAVANRLLALADRFSGAADRLEREGRDAATH